MAALSRQEDDEVYETPEFIPSGTRTMISGRWEQREDRAASRVSRRNESIEVDGVDPRDAFGRFSGAREPVSPERIRGEEPIARLRRLACSAAELEGELARFESVALAREDGAEGAGAGLVAEARRLQDQLSALLKRTESTADALSPALGAGDAVEALKALRARLEQGDEAGTGGADQPAAAAGAEGSFVTYELVATKGADGAAARAAAHAAELERRLAEVEKAVAAGDAAAAAAAAPGGTRPLTARIEALEAHVGLLTPERLAVLSRHIQVLLEERLALSTAQQAPEEEAAAETQERRRIVESIWRELEGREGWAPAVPALVDRLEQLREVHERAARQSSRLAQLEAAQARVEERLQGAESLMRRLVDAAEESASAARASAEAIAARASELEGRIAAVQSA